MRAVDMRRLSPEELAQRHGDLKDDLFRLKFQLISGQLQNFRRIREVRREIARIETIIRERELHPSPSTTKAAAEEGASGEA